MTFMPQSWASQPPYPRGGLPRTRTQKRGEREEQVSDQRNATRNNHTIQQKGDSRFQLPDNTWVPNIALGKTSQPPQSTQSKHSRRNYTNISYKITCTLVHHSTQKQSTIYYDSPQGEIARRPNWKAQTVILQMITPVWVPPWPSGSIAPSCSAKITNVLRTFYRHFYPGRHRTKLTSHYLI